MSTNPTIHPLTAAKFYLACGYSVVPILPDGSKKPAVAWQPYIDSPVSPQNLERWFQRGENGIALIQGKVSGKNAGWCAELLEFETQEIYFKWAQAMSAAGYGEILDLPFPTVSSPGGGIHLFYRHLDEPQGNQKLARGLAKVAGHNGDTLIETRGEGGYVLAPGSPAACHPTGKPYQLISGTFKRVPVLNIEQRQAIFAVARSLDEKPAPTQKPRPTRAIETQGAQEGARPGDDFNERGGAEALACLERHGWSVAKDHGEWQEMCRPGKTRGSSATFGYVAPGVLHVFSSNAAPFELDATCGAFEIVTTLDFGGDYKACARMLGSRGYGAPLPAYTPTNQAKPASRPAMRPADYEAMKQEGREIHIRLVAVLRLCELGHIAGWPDPMPQESEEISREILQRAQTMPLVDCIESLLSELGTSTKGKAWDLLRQIDTVMDEAGLYVEHHDCVMFYMDWLEKRFPAQQAQGQEVGA